jgi:hypothetical protein
MEYPIGDGMTAPQHPAAKRLSKTKVCLFLSAAQAHQLKILAAHQGTGVSEVVAVWLAATEAEASHCG